MSELSVKLPDMSRNMALAGKTVSSKGRNITYNEDGYVIKSVNCDNKRIAGTAQGVFAPNRDAVLAAGDRGAYSGLSQDKEYFSNDELAMAADTLRRVATGELDERTAVASLNSLRTCYGYTGGVSGMTYAKLSFPERPGFESQSVLAEQGGVRSSEASASYSKAGKPEQPPRDAVWSVAPEQNTAQSSQQAAVLQAQPSAQQEAARQVRAQLQQTQDAVRQLQSDLGLPQTPAAQESAEQSEDDEMRILKKEVQRLQEDVQQLQYSYQSTLVQQQQRQTLQSELKDQQRQNIIQQFSESGRVSDALLDLMNEEDENG